MKAGRLVVIDEIGPMEIRSAAFRETVIEALESNGPVLATIFARPLPFTEKLKRRRDVTVIELRPGQPRQARLGTRREIQLAAGLRH